MATVTKPTVLITGCTANGIGHAMATAFHARGYYVFATARNPASTGTLSAQPDTELLRLDVTSRESIAAAREVVMKRTGGRLDALINNAGIESNAPLLDADMDAARALFDVNVFGTLAMTQAFAPLLVAAKGVVFNQSSIDAELNMVWAGVFAASKAALARISTTLQLELAPLGVRVITSVSGSADTPMFGKPGGPMVLPEGSYYRGIEIKAWEERMDHQKQATKVEVLAEQLVKEVVGGKTGVVWHGAFAGPVGWARWFHSTGWLEGMINGSRGVAEVKKPQCTRM